jgi:curved DNA-binding protein CbpA
MSEHQDYYKVLRVSEHATLEEIKQSFRRLARECHPDLHPNDENAAERFRLLREAYEVLSDATRRNRYDRNRQNQSPPSQQKPSSQVYYVRGVEKILVQDYWGAISALSEAIRLNNRFIEAYLKRCEAYLGLGEDRAILEDCQRVLKYQPDNAIAYYYRGRARQRLGYTDSAIRAYTKAIRLNQDFAPPYYYRGIANHELKFRKRAISDWREYATICKQQGNMQGYRLGMDTLSRYSWLPVKLWNRTFGQWWHLGRERIENLFQRNRPVGDPPNPFNRIFTPSQNVIRAFFSTFFQVMKDPVGGILPAYGSLESRMVATVAFGFIALSELSFLAGMLSRFGSSWEAAWRWLIVGMIPILSLFGISMLTRSFFRHLRHWTADLFLASSSVLPLAFFFLVSSLMPSFVLLFIGIFAFSHTILLLYGGCSQLLNVSESQAALIVPVMITISMVITWIGLAILF